MPLFQHDAPAVLRLGLIFADGIRTDARSSALEPFLAGTLEARKPGLDPDEDAFRRTVRDVFRNRSYKPTGRAKPASEYLLRAASEGTFPRINLPVDVCNAVSLKSLLPISVWDLDRVDADVFRFRLGEADESYVFNDAGQEIALQDLIVGCACRDASDPGRPIVNGVRDSMATKTRAGTTRFERRFSIRMTSPLAPGSSARPVAVTMSVPLL